ncbi:MAG: hypothetical protein HGA19_00165 [Oscillochloris sp.]|nr:hypothetical protein [Oscillochloris sp.]
MAYQALLKHIADGGQAHWVQQSFTDTGVTYPAGTITTPDELSSESFSSYIITNSRMITPSLALQATGTRVAIFRSSVSATSYGAASWEVADVRQALDGYLNGTLAYDILSEDELTRSNLTNYAILILPAIRQGNESDVTTRIGEAGLAAIADFVHSGGTLYTQSNGASIGEAAGLVAAGTINLNQQLRLAASAPVNTGMLRIQDSSSPLSFSWITNTLYLLNDPPLSATDGLTTVATLSNLDSTEAPAILSGQVGAGRVILVAGHPTAPLHPEQLPIFLNAVFWALGVPAELSADAVQIYNPSLDSHLLPAYEPGTPISVTLSFTNLWDTPVSHMVVTQTINPKFVVRSNSFSSTDQTSIISDTAGTQVVWNIGTVPPGTISLNFQIETGSESLARGTISAASGKATFDYNQHTYTINHQPITLTARMAARIAGEREIEGDRQYWLPATGIDLDIRLPLENKEDTLAHNIVVTDVIPLLTPIVSMADQSQILHQTNGQTVWIQNEVKFYNEQGSPFTPPDGYNNTETIGLSDWDGTVASFALPNDTQVMFIKGGTSTAESIDCTGNVITIPSAYKDVITVTKDHRLLLPVKVLTWTQGEWAGYAAKQPAIRYHIKSQELFGRRVTFSDDTHTHTGDVVIDGPEGTIFTHLGDSPQVSLTYLQATKTYVPTAPATPEIHYTDLWGRPHSTTLRSTFYNIFSWASCPTGTEDCTGETHASLGVTFRMLADLNGDGLRNEETLTFPSHTNSADLDIVIKIRSLGGQIAENQLVIDTNIFRGLGFRIKPRSGSWRSSWNSSDNSGILLSVTTQNGYDQLLFVHGLAAHDISTITLQAEISGTSSTISEGMMKLQDGVRLTYRKTNNGQNRYEISNTSPQGIIGSDPNLLIRPKVTPNQINIYGGDLYLVYEIDDANDPRSLTRNGTGDPFLQTYGFGDLSATTYVGGENGNQILHSRVAPGEFTRIRIEITNNQSNDVTEIQVVPQPPTGIRITRSYTSTIPTALMGEGATLYAESIPAVGHGLYLFDVSVDPNYSGARGETIEIPINVTANGLPTSFKVPPAQIGIPDTKGYVARIFGPAYNITLSDLLPTYVTPLKATLANAANVNALLGASNQTDRNTIFQSLTTAVGFQTDGQNIRYELPANTSEQIYNLHSDHRLFVITHATIQAPQAGTIAASQGAIINYADEHGRTWTTTGEAQTVEASGAIMRVAYNCVDVSTGVIEAGIGCILNSHTSNTVTLEVRIANNGDYPAQDVHVSLTIPTGITIVSSTPQAQITNQTVTWKPGDIAPGGAVLYQLKLFTPATTTTAATPASIESITNELLVISQSEAQFTDGRSGHVITAQAGDSLRLPVAEFILDTDHFYNTYLPLIEKTSL